MVAGLRNGIGMNERRVPDESRAGEEGTSGIHGRFQLEEIRIGGRNW